MKFSEVAIGQKFKVNGIEYEKVQPQKISCCKTLNALNTGNNEKVMIKPVQEVELVTE